jgi:cytochrome c peroxidase
MAMYNYDTVSAAISSLKQRGYDLDFNLSQNCLTCHKDRFDPEDFEITEVYRFEGNSDPADEAVVYAIESNKGHKGVLVNGFGPSSDELSSEMAKKLSIHHL